MTIRPAAMLCTALAGLIALPQAFASDVDGYQKCISEPQVPGFQWPQDVVVAFCADSFAELPKYKDIRQLIETGKGKELDARLQALLDGYYAGKLPEGAVFETLYGYFNWSDQVTRSLVERWVEQSPDSAFALAARGTHRAQSAAKTRGGEFSADTPQENIDGMRKQLPPARDDLIEATRRNPKLFTAHIALIKVARLSGDRKLGATSLEDALRADARNYYVREAYMTTMQPRWGGSLQRMDALAKSATRWRKQNPRLLSLEAIALAERGWQAAVDKKHAEALADLERALVVAPSLSHLEAAGYHAEKIGQNERSIELFSERLRFHPNLQKTLTQRAGAYAKLKQYDKAQADLDRALAISPDDAWVLRELAHLQMRQKKYKDAVPALERALRADPEEMWTLRQLSWVYLYQERRAKKAEPLVARMLDKDPKSGAAWLMRADVIQNVGGPGLRLAVENFVRYADEKDEDQRKALPKVKAWLAKQDRKKGS